MKQDRIIWWSAAVPGIFGVRALVETYDGMRTEHFLWAILIVVLMTAVPLCIRWFGFTLSERMPVRPDRVFLLGVFFVFSPFFVGFFNCPRYLDGSFGQYLAHTFLLALMLIPRMISECLDNRMAAGCLAWVGYSFSCFALAYALIRVDRKLIWKGGNYE